MRSNFTLTFAQRQDARAAIRLLEPLGLTLEQAARLAIGKTAPTPETTVAKVCDLFLRAKLGEKCRPSTLRWYEERISVVEAGLGDRMIDSVTRGEFKAWLEGTSDGHAARAATARAARALWRFALQQDPPLVNQVVTEGLEFAASPNGAEGSKKFLSVAQCKALLKNLEPAYRDAVVLMLFAGIRPEEIAGDGKEWLRWEHVQTKERLIRIPGEISKTGQTRVLEGLPDAVWSWLRPGKDKDPIAPTTRRTIIIHCRDATGLTAWPQDCLRHSFATYAVAATSNPGQVSLWLGHNGSPTMLYRHYRGLATKADAEKFFALAPQAP